MFVTVLLTHLLTLNAQAVVVPYRYPCYYPMYPGYMLLPHTSYPTHPLVNCHLPVVEREGPPE